MFLPELGEVLDETQRGIGFLESVRFGQEFFMF